jgi:hypothetical protein
MTAAAAALLAVAALAGPAAATASAEPTLTLAGDCSQYPPYNAIEITLSGFPPNSYVTGTADPPDHAKYGPQPVQTDGNGNFSILLTSLAPGTWTVTVTWEGGTLVESLEVACGPEIEPKPPPDKHPCKHRHPLAIHQLGAILHLQGERWNCRGRG